jgi:hypothetical protein
MSLDEMIVKISIEEMTVYCTTGLFEHKLALNLISLTFICAKWMKFKPTFFQTFIEIRR